MVVSLDSSRKAMDTLEENLRMNGFDKSRHESVVADAKVYLSTMPDDFDLIVLDPPAFAKRHADRHKALQGYRYINAAALSKIKAGGLLFTFHAHRQWIVKCLFQWLCRLRLKPNGMYAFFIIWDIQLTIR